MLAGDLLQASQASLSVQSFLSEAEEPACNSFIQESKANTFMSFWQVGSLFRSVGLSSCAHS